MTGFPPDLQVVDLMLNIPDANKRDWYAFLRDGLLRDEQSKESDFPVEYMFKEVPEDIDPEDDPVELVLAEMDAHNIEKAMIGVALDRTTNNDALKHHPDRFIGSFAIDPNAGMDGVGDLVKASETLGIKAATCFPAGCVPQVPINDRKMYPFYAKCVELGLPILVCAGVPGPRVPMACQDVALIDEVCWYFPELVFVTRHGCEPWTDLAVKLMLKWPNLYYSTSAFAPKHYPKDIIDYANTRGADKIMYAGYFPMGLSLERIFSELPDVPFRDEVWPKFLRDNAVRVFGLDD